jgi:hypothetical protein
MQDRYGLCIRAGHAGGGSSLHTAAARVGHELGRSAAAQLLQPLLRALTGRLRGILRRVPALTLTEFRQRHGGGGGLGGAKGGTDGALPELLCKSFEAALQGRTEALIADMQARQSFDCFWYLLHISEGKLRT